MSAPADPITICRSCATENPARYRFCGSCGSELGAASAARAPRRFVTVVTSDLKGSTALGERLDPESLREILGRYFDEMRLVFESHGGTIEKIIGDAIVAVFGLPTAGDDDALRGIEAASESQRVLASLNEQLDEKWGVRLVNRTGVASGEVVVGQPKAGEHVLTGETLKVATTMEQNAPPFEVLVADSTVALLGGAATVESFGVVSPKGGDETFGAHRLVAVPEREVAAVEAGPEQATEGACPRCGEVNEPGFRLCGYCGSPLAVGAPHRESRKTVTIVFADPKPTSLSGEPPSPEALRDAMAAYFEAMRGALERHGATIETFIGDAVMAVFGLPVRHEDDAVRAVRAAADMQAALPALNADLRERFGLEIGNHIGVNTGEVIAGDASLGQRLVTGDAVNTAARLEQAAGDGQIIVGGLTHRLARDQIEVEAIEPLSLKGKAEPVPAFRLIGIRAQPAQAAAGLSPFVGREAEMGRLSGALDAAIGGGGARLIAVIGDAGVGKSRLIKEFATIAGGASGARVVRGRCLPYGDGITFWPIAEIVRDAADIGADDPPEVARTKIASLVGARIGDPAEVEGITDRVAAALGLVRTAFPVAELFWGIRRLFERLAADGPLVAIVDDIHSAETTFLDLLDHLLETTGDAPILLLCSARHELIDKQPEWSEKHADRQVVLRPLTEDDAGRMIDRLLGEAGLDDSIRGRVVGAAEGNPLFVEQMVSMLVDDGILRRDGERWVAAARADSFVVPPTIHALLAARLDNLDGPERDVVEPASVVGLFFAQAAVEELVTEPLRPVVPAQLGALSRKQFVRPEAAEGEPAFRFGHQLIRDTAYGSLLKRERVALHERFVTWAERINRERGRETEFEEILGYHLEQAYRYRGELGPIDEDGRAVGERAAAKLGSAGRRAHARGDGHAAANLLRRAVRVLPREDTFRLELIADLGEALISLGQFDEAIAILDEATEIATAAGNERLSARSSVVRLYADVFGSTGSGVIERGIRAAKDAIERLAVLGDDSILAQAWRLLLLCHITTGQLAEAADDADRLLEHATRAGDTALAARTAPGIAYVLAHGPTPVAEAIVRCRALLRDVEGDRKTEAVVLGALAQLLAMVGEFDEARTLYRRGRLTLEELGGGIDAHSTSIDSSRVEILAGDLDAAERELRRDDEALAALDERYFRSTIVAILAAVRWLRGDAAEALTLSESAEALADEDDVWSQVAWRSTRAKVRARAGDLEAAVALARDAVRLANETDDIGLQADAAADHAEVLALLGRVDAAGPERARARDLYERKGDLISAERVGSANGEAVAT